MKGTNQKRGENTVFLPAEPRGRVRIAEGAAVRCARFGAAHVRAGGAAAPVSRGGRFGASVCAGEGIAALWARAYLARASAALRAANERAKENRGMFGANGPAGAAAAPAGRPCVRPAFCGAAAAPLPARPLPSFCDPQPPRAPREDALDEGIAALRRLRGLNVSERLG